MTKVMRQCCGLNDIWMTAQWMSDITRHLGYFETVGESVTGKVIGLRTHDLGLGSQPA